MKTMNKKILLPLIIAIGILLPASIFSQQNAGKLIGLLANPMSAGGSGQFTKGERIDIPRVLSRVITLQSSDNLYIYLVAINDYNVSKPFYILANRRLNLMDLEYTNTIFEDLELEYVGTDNYYSNGVPRETFVFRLSSMRQ